MNRLTATLIPTDPVLPSRLERVGRLCLTSTLLVAAVIESAWLFPPAGMLLPPGWSAMQASTAIAVLCLSIGLLSSSTRDIRHGLAQRLCANAAVLTAGTSIFAHIYNLDVDLGALFVASDRIGLSHPMSMQSAICILLLGLVLNIREDRRDAAGAVLDAVLTVLTIVSLALVAAYGFDADRFVGFAQGIRISPQTLFCIALLTFVLGCRRAPYGYFSVLVSKGISGHFARVMLPLSVGISYLIVISGERLMASDYLAMPYAAPATVAVLAILLMVVVILMAEKIKHLESELYSISITDELTGIYNRRGFHLLAEQSLLDAKRDERPVSLIFIDLDGLKKINDTLGHDAGSQLISEMSDFLRESFRKNDILGRLGGDEFAIFAYGSSSDMKPVLDRLNEAVARANDVGDKPYVINFSLGTTTAYPDSNDSLSDMLKRADMTMYRHKQNKRASQGSAAPPPARHGATLRSQFGETGQ